MHDQIKYRVGFQKQYQAMNYGFGVWMTQKAAEKNKTRLAYQIQGITFVSMFFSMFLFEFLHLLLFPTLPDLISSIITIIYSSTLAFFWAFYLQRKSKKLLSARLQEKDDALSQKIIEERKYYQEILDADPNLIYIKDHHGNYLFANQALLGFYGRSMTDLLGKSDSDLQIVVQEITASQPCEKISSDEKGESNERAIIEEMRIHRDGRSHWFDTAYRKIYYRQNKETQVVSVATDICRLKTYESQLSHERLHDTLTGLPNHESLRSYIEEKHHSHSPDQTQFALLLMDIDQFKRVNESLGYNLGDKLIIAISKRLGSCVRSTDIIARFQGDAFFILLQELTSEEEVYQIISRIFEKLSRPFTLQKQEISLTSSIGVVFGQDPPLCFDEMLQNAEIAMDQAKRKGKQRYEVFNDGMEHSQADKILLENDLRKAIEFKQLRLQYQPIIAMESGDVLTVEALVRWQHPQRGLIYPTEFIPLAEERDLIIDIGEWVLREACCQARKWQEQFHMKSDITVSVNISSKQLLFEDFIDQVSTILQESELDPRHLKMEITESIYLGRSEQVIRALNGLNELGVQLYIDDFGTGYSSLSYLSKIPFDAIKIDRSFIEGVIERNGDMKIVEAIIRLASDLGKDLVAEGVETIEQRAWLQRLGCKYEQGFLFSPPLNAVDVEKFFLTNQPSN